MPGWMKRAVHCDGMLQGLPIPSCADGLVNEYKSGGGNRRFLSYFSAKTNNQLIRLIPFHSWGYSTLYSHRYLKP
eukprot:4563423-Pyramimonas_sp.AAC.1